MVYQPKTGEKCTCKPGVHRDNCPECEGTGMRIDFRKIRTRRHGHDGLLDRNCDQCIEDGS